MGRAAIPHLRPCLSGPSPRADSTNPRAAALRNAAALGYWRHSFKNLQSYVFQMMTNDVLDFYFLLSSPAWKYISTY